MISLVEKTAPTAAAFRNIHLAPPAPVARAAEDAATPAAPFKARRRWVTRSPDEEFAARPGECEPLAPELGALILFRKQKLTCMRDGLEVVIETDSAEREVKRKFWHENSLCCQPSYLGREVFAVYNRHDPHCVYIFSEDGELIEAVPEKQLEEFFSPGAALAANKRHQDHALQRLTDLHAPDTREAIARAAENAAKMIKVVHTFPQPDGAVAERTEVVHPEQLARDAFAPATPRAEVRDALKTHRAAIARGIERHEEAAGAAKQQKAQRTATIQQADIDTTSLL